MPKNVKIRGMDPNDSEIGDNMLKSKRFWIIVVQTIIIIAQEVAKHLSGAN